jgi:release factor glutamine methyltransferase
LVMTVKDILTWGHENLILSSESARLDAELLLAHTLKKPVTFLLAHDETEIGYFALRKYRRMISQRKDGMPVAYLTGHKEFYGLDFEVNKNVLVPRPDTEILVDKVVSYLNDQIPNPKSQTNSKFKNQNSKILLDVGTGSACIPISILKSVPNIKAVATEISGSAMRVAKRNIKKHGLKSRIKLIKSDLLKNVPSRLFHGKEVIVTANLPYIPKQFAVHPSTKFEPDVALYGGSDGLDIYKRLASQLEEIKPRAIFFELFEFQAAILTNKMEGYEVKFTESLIRLGGEARCLMMEKIN